jgi:hypothetical protein
MKIKNKKVSDMAPEYDFSKGVRGKHFEKMKEGYSVTIFSYENDSSEKKVIEKISFVRIENDVNEYFQTSEEVNNALRALITTFPKNKSKLQKA